MANFSPFSLTPVDHGLVPAYIRQNLCFRSSDQQQCQSRLQAGTNLLLARLPFLTGEVVPQADNSAKPGELRVQPGNTWDTIPMVTIKHFNGVILPPALIQGNDSSKNEGGVFASLDDEYYPLPLILPPSEPRPVMRVQLNIVADGVILSLAFVHTFFDGTGTGRIHEMLAECCRAAATETPASLPTDIEEESALRNRLATCGDGIQTEIDHSADFGQAFKVENKKDDSNKEKDSKKPPAPEIKFRAFILSPEKLERLRNACNGLIPLLTRLYGKTDSRTKWPTFLSSNDVLTGLVGTCMERARKESGDDVSSPSRHLTFAVSVRKRLSIIPDHYLGNAVLPAHVYFKLPKHTDSDLDSLDEFIDFRFLEESGIDAKTLLDVANQAFQSRATILSYDDTYIRSWMGFVARQPDYRAVNIQYGQTIGASWRDLKVNTLDFGPGLGSIDNFERNTHFADGAFTIMPETKSTSGRKAPWDVRITLRAGPTEKFEGDKLITWLADRVVKK